MLIFSSLYLNSYTINLAESFVDVCFLAALFPFISAFCENTQFSELHLQPLSVQHLRLHLLSDWSHSLPTFVVY